MKKFTKICLIAAAICGVLGLGTIGCAIALGGSFSEVKAELANDSLWNRFRYELHEEWRDFWGDHDYDFDYDEHEYEHGHGMGDGYVDFEDNDGEYHTYTFSGADTLKVEVKRCEVYLEESEDQDLHVEVRKNEGGREVKVQNSGNVVAVTSESKEKLDSEIYIYLPENVKMRDVQIDAGSSYVLMENVKTENLDVTVGAGSVEAYDSVAAENSSWNVGAGVIYAFMEGAKEDYNYTVSCGVGTVELPGEEYSGLGTAQKIDNGAQQELNIECGVGSVEFEFED